MPTISSNGSAAGTGIIWATLQTVDGADTWHKLLPDTLYAIAAEKISNMLWSSDALPSDQLGLFAKFCPPMVVNGKVYVGTATTTNALRVYGLH